MGMTAGDYLCERLIEWGVNTIYGFPGDGINGILGALRRHEDQLRFIQTRHEEMASFMACGHAKFTDEVGVCLATSGPGAIHLLNGLYDAKLDHRPVVAIVGQTFSRAMGGDFQQEVNLLQLYSDVASAYVQQVTDPSTIHHMIDRAMRIAKAERTVTCVIVPADIQDMDAVPEQPLKTHTVHSGVGWWPPRLIPSVEQLQTAADILNAGQRVAILVGQGALHATGEVLAVADALGAGVAKALLGKAAVPDDVPYCTGSIGLLGTKPSWDMMQGADTLLMVGSSFPYSEFLPPLGQAKAIQIDLAARNLSIRYAMDLALVGDSKDTLGELLPLLRRKEDRTWQKEIEKNVTEWWQLMDERGEPSDLHGRIRPQGLFSSLSRHLPDNAILSSDSGTAANWYARQIKIRTGMKAMLSGNLATMVPGVPYAIAAKFAFPDRVSVAMVGDGAMQMGGMAEMLTALKYYKTWSDPRLIVLVLNNEDLNQVTWEQRAMEGDPRFEGSQAIPYMPFADYANLIGLKGIKVTTASQIEGAWDEAFAADRPVIIDAITTPDEPPIPPHVTRQEAEALMKSVLADPKDGWRGALEGIPRDGSVLRPGALTMRTIKTTRLKTSRVKTASHGEVLGEATHVIDKILRNVQHGTFERSLSGLTAVAAAVTTAEIFIEHYRASFGNKWMWSPIIATPPVVVAGIMGVFSRKWAKTVLPATALVYTANGLLGEFFHARGVARRPGGWGLASYNLPMGPPIAAPGLMTLVGGMGLLAALLRREAE